MRALSRYRSIMGNRPYVLLLASSVISEAGDWAARLTLTWLTYLLTDSVPAAAGVLVLSVLPAAMVGPWVAARTSRWDHRVATISCDLVRAGLFAAVALRPTPVTALLVAAAAGLLSVVFESHRSAWLPHVTGTDALGTAVSLAHALSDATVIAGYAVGGVLLGLLGVSGVLWINTATFLVSAVLLVGVGRARSADPEDDSPTGLRAAANTLLADRVLLLLAGTATLAVAAATGVEAVALPVLTSSGVPVTITGVVLAAGAGLSLAVTLALPGQWTHSRASVWVGLLIATAFAGCAAGLAVGSPALTAAAVIITGLAYVALVPANVLLTINVPAHLRTSMFALLAAALAILQAVMAMSAAYAIEQFGLAGLAWICGGIAVLSAGVLLAGAGERRPAAAAGLPEEG